MAAANSGAEITARYIRQLYKPEDRIAVVLINKQEGVTIQRIANAGDVAGKYIPWLRAMNAQKYDIYVSMNPLKQHAHSRKKADIAEVRHVFLDIDEGGKEKLEHLLAREDVPPPHWVLESSPGHFQPIWRVEGFSPGQAETWARNMVREFGADPARIDVSSVMRLPGFRNQKYQDIYHLVSVKEISKTPAELPERFPAEMFHAERVYERVARDSGATGRKFDGPDQTPSGRDWGFVMRALERGEDPEEIIRKMLAYKPEKYPGYVRNTVMNALARQRHPQQEVERHV